MLPPGSGGAGKSSFARALGAEVNRPTIILDVGALMGGPVGAAEENARRAPATVAAMTPRVLFVDEVVRGRGRAGAGRHVRRGDRLRRLGPAAGRAAHLADGGRPPGGNFSPN